MTSFSILKNSSRLLYSAFTKELILKLINDTRNKFFRDVTPKLMISLEAVDTVADDDDLDTEE